MEAVKWSGADRNRQNDMETNGIGKNLKIESEN